ncbi:PREDICTED: C-type lectin domain family 4 member G [Elephantulus edwardii]|uniref:C-type lectin domain family 4 member G n=1 Tax=Elephantulus edwardii TaxID=28737 RepID=UPI0003F0A9D8|nr:PREDICTED: C-type lectin domain family 4 member G [Elephantulus edwardii]
MDNSGYRKWDGSPEGVPGGQWGRCGQKSLVVTVVLVAAGVLWSLVLSVLLSKASSELGVLLGHQDLLRTNASKQAEVLNSLQEGVGTCKTCCSEVKVQLQTTRTELGEAQKKLMELGSSLNELRERVTKDTAQAGRDREDIRSELLRALEAAKFGNNSCEPCPTSWLPFAGSCYFFSKQQDKWEKAQMNCGNTGAHLVLVGDLEEQAFLSQNTRGRGYWLGLRTVRRAGKVQGYQWVDGVPLTFSHWNTGEPNDSRGREDCVMMLHSGLWNDAPCENERDSWICEKRRRC